MARRKLICYFEETPPTGSAVAIRAKFFISALKTKITNHSTPITVLTATSGAQNEPGVKYLRFKFGRHSSYSSVHLRILSEIVFGLKASFWLCLNRSNASLVISSPNYLTSLFLSLFAWCLRVPYVLDLRDLYPDAYAESSLIRSSSLAFRLLDRASDLMYKNAVSVTTATLGIRARVCRVRMDAHCIYNGFPSEFIRLGQQKHSRFTVAFHGIFGFFQDIGTLAQLIRHPSLSDVDFVVIGYGRKENLIKDIVAENFKYFGRLSHDETIKEISRCHLGISLRLKNQISEDSFPVKVWEYLGLGIPSLVYPKSEASDFLTGYNCGIELAHNNVEYIASVIKEVRDNSGLYESMKSSCLYARASYTREALAARFSELAIRSLAV